MTTRLPLSTLYWSGAPAITRGTWPRYYCWTDTGYLDADNFKGILANVAEEWRARNPGTPALLFADQLAAHRRADIVEYALGLGLYIFSLRKNTSHFNQPLDAAPFGALHTKKTHRTEEAMIDAILTNASTRDTLLQAAYEAERRAFGRPVISGAFRRCGLWPFDPDLMQAAARVTLGMHGTKETVVEAARRAAADVIQAAQQRVDESSAAVVSGRAVVKRGVVHSPVSLLEQHRRTEEETAKDKDAKDARRVERAENKAERDRPKAEKAASRELRRCRGCAGKVYCGGKSWTGCDCGLFWVCPPCSNSMQAGMAMAAHIKECTGPVGEACGSDSASEAQSSDSVSTE